MAFRVIPSFVLAIIMISVPFVINIDELGRIEFVNAINIIPIVYTVFLHNEIKFPVKKCCKNTLIISSICCKGSIMIPGIVVNKKPTETEFYEARYTDDKVCIGHQGNCFLKNTFFLKKCKIEEIFNTWAKLWLFMMNFVFMILIGSLMNAILIHIIPLFIIPHSNDQCQPLDIRIFFNIKQKCHQ